jgi:hypothetical protein
MVKQFGGAPVGGPGSGNLSLAGGNVYFVNGASGLAANSGSSPDHAVATLSQGYAKTANNNNDMVVLVGDSSGVQLGLSTDTAGLTWANSYTHLIGACAPVRVAKRARIFHNFDIATLLTISGGGCSFENWYLSHGRGSATNLTGVSISGSRNYFGNVHFSGPSHATEADEATYVLVNVAGGDETMFERCNFGNPNIAMTDSGTLLSITSGGKYTYIKDTDFLWNPSDVDTVAFKLGALQATQCIIVMENVAFIAGGTASPTQAIDSNLTSTTYAKIVIKPPLIVVGCDDVADATGDGTIFTERYSSTANVIGLGISPAVA